MGEQLISFLSTHTQKPEEVNSDEYWITRLKFLEEEIDKSSEEKKDEEEQKESSETEKTEVNQKEEEKTELRSYSKFDLRSILSG